MDSINDASTIIGTSTSSEMRWIESEYLANSAKHNLDSDDVEDTLPECFDLFADPNPTKTFSFQWKISKRPLGLFEDIPCENCSAENEISLIPPVTRSNEEIVCEDDSFKIISIDLTGHKPELGQTLHSTGLTLWRASGILCEFMISERTNYVTHKKILELGSGLGLCGILAHRLDASLVVLTDGDTDTLKNLRMNVNCNCLGNLTLANNTDCRIHCTQLVWGNDIQIQTVKTVAQKFDVILGSDIIYVEEILNPLWGTISQLLDPIEGRFLLSYARRNVSIDLVLDTAINHGFEWEVPSFSSEGVFIFRKKF